MSKLDAFDFDDESRGSSVSTHFKDEYNNVLRHAVVVPNVFDNRGATDTNVSRGDMNPALPNRMAAQEESDRDEVSTSDESSSRVITSESEGDLHRRMLSSMPPRARIVPDRIEQMPPPTSGFDPAFRYRIPPRTDQLFDEVLFGDGGDAADAHVDRLTALYDQWSADLRRNVLAEFGHARCRIAGQFKEELMKEREAHLRDLEVYKNEIEHQKELLATYEISLGRKDQVISNLSNALHRHRDRVELMRKFAEWKVESANRRREHFTERLARQHYERSTMRKFYHAWHVIIENKWRFRVEKACQMKAQDVCIELTNDYEAKIASLNGELEQKMEEIRSLRRERDAYEENMKKAFMRGVCALNSEAMNMFKDTSTTGAAVDQENVDSSNFTSTTASTTDDIGPYRPVNEQAKGVVIGGKHVMVSDVVAAAAVTSDARPKKSFTARIVARSESSRPNLPSGGGGSPVRPKSISVERHTALNKETISKAVFKKPVAQSETIHRR